MEAKKADARLQMSHETDQKTEKMVLVLCGGRGSGGIFISALHYTRSLIHLLVK